MRLMEIRLVQSVNANRVKERKVGEKRENFDPRQTAFWALYLDTNSETFSNATQSAISVGYTEMYSRAITREIWFKDKMANLRRGGMLEKAERNIEKILDLKYEKEDGEIVGEALRAVTDMSKTIVKTLGKEHYSERSEVTGKNGEALYPKPIMDVSENDSNEEDTQAEEAA